MGNGAGKGDMEEEDRRPYRRPQMTGEARGKEERNNYVVGWQSAKSGHLFVFYHCANILP